MTLKWKVICVYINRG